MTTTVSSDGTAAQTQIAEPTAAGCQHQQLGAVAGLEPELSRVCGCHLQWVDANGAPTGARAELVEAGDDVGGRYAAVVEPLHNLSLAHDGVMAGGATRRGRPAHQYYDEFLQACVEADELGFSHIRAVEHYFNDWGGYSPDPVVFLTAVATRTHRVRLATGALVPALHHPVKLAAALSMLDNISGGRLDAGFCRGALPTAFSAFDVPLAESRERMQEGVAAVRRLWQDEEFRWQGPFHQFGPLPALLPRPLQQPHPPVFIAASSSPQTYEWAGTHGCHLMIVPIVTGHETLARLLATHRAAWERAGHAGPVRLHVSYLCYLAPDSTEAVERAQTHFEYDKRQRGEAFSTWRGITSDHYPGYERAEDAVRKAKFVEVRASGGVIVGDVEEAVAALLEVEKFYPGAEASLQVRFGGVTHQEALRTVRLLGTQVLPRLTSRG